MSLPKTYKHTVFKAQGEPLTLEEVTLRAPAEGEILVKVEACGVCYSDISGKVQKANESQLLRPLKTAAVGVLSEGQGNQNIASVKATVIIVVWRNIAF
ncbi:uncharacterized protein THITE_2084022 [Thermothielavioides terrestris NRRL 8126]|uniref:Uncharacterized protein n=1 Tax=Thermothielavioides terrestris (strain ATCC 38088 / NRRL 8126) TaxID=578455 RepID=G2QRG1_THETT|nr:uncharacterized protein THITE_2084022 [Thermothielavioides terrestris NRRL 8126]AEO62506.1 hypothetical protein THITE_2084022 [Thermothielavioides terrestris NRRL 8126]